jgi:imidazolonepropionase-like amidohydrolase
MKIPSRAVAASVALSLLLLPVSAPSLRAAGPEPPPFFAIRDARVVTVSGEELPRATVVIVNGLIAAVGADVAIPPEAWVIDGEGLVVYPGLIDAMATVGQKQEGGGPGGAAAAQGGNPFAMGADQPQVRGPQDRPGTTPWVRAADRLDPADSRLEKWRMAGFTGVVSVPKGGFFPGQAALINTAGDEAQELVVAPAVAHHVDVASGGESFRSFPGSLMGKISYVRQVWSDATHYQQATAIYEQAPAGLQRPDYDRTLQPLQEARAADLPMLLPANRANEIHRALALASELDLVPILYGVQEGYRALDELKRSGAAVLVSTEWPERAKDVDPDADLALATAAFHELAPTVPAALHGAGVRFAFTSGGAAAPSDILEGVRKAVTFGLPANAALRALTLDAARLYGLHDRLGSIETGKIANLVVATDLPWVEGAKVEQVFVDGRRFAVREEKPKAPPGVDPSGTWAITMSSPRGDVEATADLKMAEDGSLSGEVRSQMGTARIDRGRVEGSTVSFQVSMQMGPRTAEASYRAEVTGESLEGTVSMGPIAGEFRGTRTVAAAESARAASADEATAPRVAWSELEPLRGPYAEWPVFAIRGATVFTQGPQGILQDATVLVRDGKIAAVGPDVNVPSGARVIDGAGKYLIPGIIDAHSHIAIDGGVNEGTLAVTSMVRIEDVLDPEDISIYRALAGGVTAANLLHGSANPIGGQNATIKLRWGGDAADLLLDGAPPGIKFALGENPKRSNMRILGAPQRYPATRMGVMDVIRESFQDAREYARALADYEAAKKAGRKAIPPRRDLKLEALVEILEGKRIVHAHCYRADEILQLLRLADEFGFQIATLQHVLEGYRVADEIAAHGAGASTFSDWWAFKVEAYEAIPHNAALMTRRGVLVSINSDDAEEMRHLNQEAAKTIPHGGLTEEEALALVTINPAKQLRIDDRVGSIEVGKDADLVLYDAHPLSTYAVPQQTYLDGKLYFDRELDRERRARIEALKQKLSGEEKAEDEPAPAAEPTSTPSTTPETSPVSTDPRAEVSR